MKDLETKEAVAVSRLVTAEPAPVVKPPSVLSRPKRRRFLPLAHGNGDLVDSHHHGGFTGKVTEASERASTSTCTSTSRARHPPHPRPLKGIVFDLDGTLCLPQTWMFASMRSALGIPKSVDILTHITTLPTPQLRIEAHEKIKAIEVEAMKQMVPSAGLVPLLTYLSNKAIKTGICTRNFEGPVKHLVKNFCGGFEFEGVVTREFKGAPKPDPAGLVVITEGWGVEGWIVDGDGGDEEGVEEEKEKDKTKVVRDVIMVGDSMDDMLAGRRAGCVTVLLLGEHNVGMVDSKEVDVVISRLDELIDMLEKGLEVFE